MGILIMIYLFCERFLDLRYFLEILASNPSGLDIEFSQDGSWSVFKEERTGKTRELGSLASLSSILEITLSSPHAESEQICKKFSSVHAEIKVLLEREAASLLGSLLLI